MRVLIADRNVRLLEAISHTFARDFTITTAMTLQRCSDLLRRCDFDLAIVSEKLSDGPGLRLLGKIAHHSPETLRIFAARRSRLDLLKGRLGPLGLFQTLAYPIEAGQLSSVLTLARAGGRAPVAAPSPAATRPRVERIRFNFKDASLATNVPVVISRRVLRRSAVPTTARQMVIATGAGGRAFQTAPSRIEGPARSRIQPHAPSRIEAPAPPRGLSRVTPLRSAAPSRRKPSLMLGATIAAVLATLALILHSPDVHPTRAPLASVERQPPDIPAVSRENFAPSSLTTPIPAEPHAAKHGDPTPTPPATAAEPALPEVATTTTPLADPSTFSSEAYEPIYSN
jgi:ActR/RegA family two-component response regulator